MGLTDPLHRHFYCSSRPAILRTQADPDAYVIVAGEIRCLYLAG